MSYQRVLKPRAYLNMISPSLTNGKMSLTSGTYSNSDIKGAGLISNQSDVLQLFDNNPANTVGLGGKATSTTTYITIDTHMTPTDTLLGETMFIAILNHNFQSAGAGFRVQLSDNSGFISTDAGSGGDVVVTPPMIEVCNAVDDTSTGYHEPDKNGWSLVTYSAALSGNLLNNRYQRIGITPNSSTYSTNIDIGCIVWGIVYDFPQSPDLKLSQTFVHSKSKKSESLGGQIYGHTTYTNNPAWLGSSDPFDNKTTGTAKSFKSGKKQLDLSFSYLADTDVFTEKLYDVDSSTNDDSLVSRIVWFTNNGLHPLLLQYDNSDVTDLDGDDQFLFCRLTNSPKFEQVAHRQYNTALTFLEEY
tara:strand:+ start:143 stop:1219 length:1077 start_codon:yes stop_codon:yes gene_type:complete